MIWGCISYHGVGPLTMVNGTLNAQGYLKIIDENVWPVIAKHFSDGDYYFQDEYTHGSCRPEL